MKINYLLLVSFLGLMSSLIVGYFFGQKIFAIFYFATGILVSSIYTYKLFEIHDMTEEKTKPNKWWVYNLQWLYFLSSFIGWVLLYYLLIFRIHFFSLINSAQNLNTFKFEWSDFIILLTVFFGITGQLPYVILKYIQNKEIK